ncbi:HSF5 protein, partial [Halcyon senegalensis]|nr:HSF5 protein [Halcyon senegalensis]
PDSINPDSFPAKLWWLVNSPRCRSVYWDTRGQELLIEEQLFVREVLGAGPAGEEAAGAANLFKTKRFTSIVRQLNLYGFHKLVKEPLARSGPISHPHHYHSPHFRRHRPDLVVHLKRLTRARKVKVKVKVAVSMELPGQLLP